MSDNEQENESEKRETVADIVAQIRAAAYIQNADTPESVLRLADRIEAAWKREARAIATEHAVLPAVCITKPAGNAAAMREALVEAIGETCAGCKRDCDDCMNLKSGWMKKAKAALSAPPRQCDVGTAEEQTKRLRENCNKYKPSCKGCKYVTDLQKENCWLRWAQMPYAKEGAGK